MNTTKNAGSKDDKWVSPHVAKREAKKARALARSKQEKDPSYIQGIWNGFMALFNRQEKVHVHVPTPAKVRSSQASLIKAIRPGKHRNQLINF